MMDGPKTVMRPQSPHPSVYRELLSVCRHFQSQTWLNIIVARSGVGIMRTIGDDDSSYTAEKIIRYTPLMEMSR